MIIVSEQQTFARLKLPPKPLDEMTDDEVLMYVAQLQGEREKTAGKKPKEPKDPNAPKAKRKPAGIDFSEGE